MHFNFREKATTTNGYIKRLRVLQTNPDKEEVHVNADKILCEILLQLGYSDVVSEYEKIDKWYA